MNRTRSAAAPRPGLETAPDPGVPRAVSIPASAKKHVEMIKQTGISASEEEIYVEYRQCNCDVNETITRLLQNPFEEVKGKKKKHKEEPKKPQEQSFGSGAPYGANYGTGSTYGAPHSSSDSRATRPSSGGGFRGGRGGGRFGGRADAHGRGSGGAQQQGPAFGGHPARENGIHPRSAGSGPPASSAGTWGQAAKGPGAEARPVAQTGAGQGVSAPGSVGQSAQGDARGTLFSRASPAASSGWGDSAAAATSSAAVPSSTGGSVPVATGWGPASGHRSAVDIVKSGGLHQQQAAPPPQQAQAHAQPDAPAASSGYESGSSSGPNSGGFSSQSDAVLRNAAAPGSRPSSAAPGRAPAAVGSQIGVQGGAGGAKDAAAGAGDRAGGAGPMMGAMSSMGLGAAPGSGQSPATITSSGAEAASQGEADSSLSMAHQMGVRGGATGWGGMDTPYDAAPVSKVDTAVTKMKDLSIGSSPAPTTVSSLGDAAVIMPPSLQMQAGHTGLSFGSFGDGFGFSSGFSTASTSEGVPSVAAQGMQGSSSRAPGAASAASSAVGAVLKDSTPSVQDSGSANQLASSGVSLASSASQGSYSVPSDSTSGAQAGAPAQQAPRQLPVKATQPSASAAAVTNILPMAPSGAVAAQAYGSYGVPPMTGSYGFNASQMPTGGAGTFGSPYDAGVEAQADISRQGLYQDASAAMLYSQPFRPSAVDASGIDSSKYGLGAAVTSASSASAATNRYMQPASSAVVGPSSAAASLPSTLPTSAGGAVSSGSSAAPSTSQSSSQSSVSAAPSAPQRQQQQQQQQQAQQQAPAVHPAVPAHQHQHQAALQPPLAMQQQHSQFAGTPGMGPSAAQYGNTAAMYAPPAYYIPQYSYMQHPYQYTSTPGYPQGAPQATTFPQGAGGSYGAPSTGGPVKFPNNQFTNPYSKMSGSNTGGGVPHAAGSSRGYNTGYSAQHYATGTVAPGAAGSGGGYEDMSAGQYKQDTSLFIPSQQQQGQIPRDMAAGMPTTSYYNLQPQGQYTHGQQQPTHHAYGMYHPSQGAQPAHQMMQAQATMGAGQPSAGGYNQPLRDGQQLSWNNSSY